MHFCIPESGGVLRQTHYDHGIVRLHPFVDHHHNKFRETASTMADIHLRSAPDTHSPSGRKPTLSGPNIASGYTHEFFKRPGRQPINAGP